MNNNFDINDRIRGTLGTRRGEHFGKGPKSWKRTDDMIRENVCEVLFESPVVDASDIEVEVENGLVYLRGRVSDRASKTEAERCAEEVNGIIDVQNELRIA